MSLFRPDRPFRPAALPIFYGWVILVASSLGVVMSIPGQTMGVGPFNESLLAVLPVSRLQLSLAYLGGTAGGGLLLPWGGRMYDRFGARRLVVVACWGLAGTLLLLSQVDRLAPADGLTCTLVLTLLFLCLRFTGQGMLTMVSRNMLAKWFRRRRGLSNGIAGVVVACGFGSAPVLLNALVIALGWRQAWLVLALVVGLGMAAVGWLFYRDNPEECGLRMDGEPQPADDAPTESAERGASWDQARRTLAFWSVTAALSVQALVVTGFTFHIEALSLAQGLQPAIAYALFLPIALIATGTGFLVGWACDHLPLRWLVQLMMVAQAVGCIGAMALDQPTHYWLTVAGWGISGGCFGPLAAVALPNYFGRLHLGAISGKMMSVLVLASAMGPLWLALVADWTGGYRLAMASLLLLPVLALVLAVPVRPPVWNTD